MWYKRCSTTKKMIFLKEWNIMVNYIENIIKVTMKFLSFGEVVIVCDKKYCLQFWFLTIDQTINTLKRVFGLSNPWPLALISGPQPPVHGPWPPKSFQLARPPPTHGLFKPSWPTPTTCTCFIETAHYLICT